MGIYKLIKEKLDKLGNMPIELMVWEIIRDIQSRYPGTPAELIAMAILYVQDCQVKESKMKNFLKIELIDAIFVVPRK